MPPRSRSAVVQHGGDLLRSDGMLFHRDRSGREMPVRLDAGAVTAPDRSRVLPDEAAFPGPLPQVGVVTGCGVSAAPERRPGRSLAEFEMNASSEAT